MFDDLKKKVVKRNLLPSIIMLIVAVAAFFAMGRQTFYAITGYIPLASINPDKLKNQYVEVEVVYNFGSFAYRTSRNSSTNISEKTDAYWVVVMGDGDEGSKLITLRVPTSYTSQMNDVYYSTKGTGPAASLTLYGKVSEMDESVNRLYLEYLENNLNRSSSDIQELSTPYCVDIFRSKGSMDGMAFFVTGVGLILLILSVVRLCRLASGATLKDFKAAISAEGLTESAVEADYHRAKTFTKEGDIRVGKLLTYNILGAHPMAIPNRKMLWAYQSSVTHRTNGVKTGTSYSVIIYLDGEGKARTIPVSGEKTAQALLAYIGTTLPWVVLGYTDQTRELFFQDRAQFKAMRYNTVEHVAVDNGSHA